MTAAYPHTPHWPGSPALAASTRQRRIMQEPERFLWAPVTITEKLDGLNTALAAGRITDRSGHTGTGQPWLAMARRHHAWKTAGPELAGITLHAEDLYAVHTIEYGPVPESGTLRVFASTQAGIFHRFAQTRALADCLGIPTVPVLHEGSFDNLEDLQELLDRLHAQPSALGGPREGLVIRLSQGFPGSEFHRNVAKSVRAGHVRPDAEHWRRNWRPCRLSDTA